MVCCKSDFLEEIVMNILKVMFCTMFFCFAYALMHLQIRQSKLRKRIILPQSRLKTFLTMKRGKCILLNTFRIANMNISLLKPLPLHLPTDGKHFLII